MRNSEYTPCLSVLNGEVSCRDVIILDVIWATFGWHEKCQGLIERGRVNIAILRVPSKEKDIYLYFPIRYQMI
jgi:hypothetical protein